MIIEYCPHCGSKNIAHTEDFADWCKECNFKWKLEYWKFSKYGWD